jgi:1-acyl-sn-glycerol-3-phosphate acyltransferase
MSLASSVVNNTIKGLARLLCKVDASALACVPAQGPLLLVANPINFLDAPVTYTHLQPRLLTGLVKAETWKNPLMGFFFTTWGGIPIQRGEPDRSALHQSLQALNAGKIVAVALEGKRSGDGRLKRGHPGVATLALHSRAPVLPLAFYGGEQFRGSLSRVRRTDFYIAVGVPFTDETGEGKATLVLRQVITDEIMYQIAALLPPAYRGEYAELAAATQKYLRFLT